MTVQLCKYEHLLIRRPGHCSRTSRAHEQRMQTDTIHVPDLDLIHGDIGKDRCAPEERSSGWLDIDYGVVTSCLLRSYLQSPDVSMCFWIDQLWLWPFFNIMPFISFHINQHIYVLFCLTLIVTSIKLYYYIVYNCKF